MIDERYLYTTNKNPPFGYSNDFFDNDYEKPYLGTSVMIGEINKIIGRGRIKEGAGIFQDHHFGRWPSCCPPKSEWEGDSNPYSAKDPDMLFDVEWDGRCWVCKADGYGHLRSQGDSGEYGSGSIFVKAFDGVEVMS